MRIIFMDEAGYTYDWIKGMKDQPFYVVSAVCIPVRKLHRACEQIRDEVGKLNIPELEKPLGQGSEIKAKDVARGTGWWGKHERERNLVRNLMLSFPKNNNGCAIVVVIDKQKFYDRYSLKKNPYNYALKFALERVQRYLERKDDYGIVIYDLNPREEPRLSQRAMELMRNGSEILKWRWSLDWDPIVFTLKIDRVLEFTFGRSENSIGLIVADFFATMTYHYHKEGKPASCGWWEILKASLDKVAGKLDGYGYKLFP